MASFYSKSNLKINNVSKLDVTKEILNLSSKKATIKDHIPAQVLRNIINAYLSELTILINNCLKKGFSPYGLKPADITPTFEKEDSLNKENYRPVSMLPHLSKVIVSTIYKQIDNFMENKFSHYLFGFRQKQNAQ